MHKPISTRTSTRTVGRSRDGNGTLLPARISAAVCALPTPTPCAVMGSNSHARRLRGPRGTSFAAELAKPAHSFPGGPRCRRNHGERLRPATRGQAPSAARAILTHKSFVNSSKESPAFGRDSPIGIVLRTPRHLPCRRYRSLGAVKNSSPWAKRFGLRKKPSSTAPLGATASCRLPAGRHTN
jgi:hypothetical protein